MLRLVCRSTIQHSSRSTPQPAELDLAVVLHTFTVMPPYAPGGQDTWDNLWLQRSAAHPWCGMRNMAAMIGSGVMDRYPTLRVGTLEAGQDCYRSGWRGSMNTPRRSKPRCRSFGTSRASTSPAGAISRVSKSPRAPD